MYVRTPKASVTHHLNTLNHFSFIFWPNLVKGTPFLIFRNGELWCRGDNHCYWWGLSNSLMLDEARFGKLLVASTNLKCNTPHSNTENQFALFTDQSQSSKPLSLLSGMVCCGVGKDNHCYWGLSTSLMLDEARFGKLLIASTNLKGSSPHSSNTHLHCPLFPTRASQVNPAPNYTCHEWCVMV